jgi:integrase
MRYTVIRGFLMHCGVDPKKLIDASTHNALKKLPELNTAPYSRNEVERLLAVCNPYYKMVFTLLLQSGMRSREAGHLTWANINWETGQIFVPGSQSITKKVKTKVKTNIFQTKSRKGRSIPLYASLRAALQEWRKQHPDTIYVVGTPRGDNPATHWLGTLKTLARQAGLNCGVCPLCVEKGECSKWYLHRMRHTYAHRCLDAKIDLHELSRNLGHSTLAMTLLYLKGRASSNATDPFAPAPVPVADKPKVVMIDAA